MVYFFPPALQPGATQKVHKLLTLTLSHGSLTSIPLTHLAMSFIQTQCPFDYCRPLTENVSMNLNLLNGSDAQCAYNRSGILCGACREPLSLSLGSSRCFSCHSYWPAVFAAILIAAIMAGILLVTALLTLNMTVAVGLINGFIFYANILAANTAVFFPSSELLAFPQCS